MMNDSRLMHSWSVFSGALTKHNVDRGPMTQQSAYYMRSVNVYKHRDIISNVISRIALDASMAEFKHMRINKLTENQEPVDSKLQRCLSFEANIDQSGRSFIYDVVWSMLDEGVVAIVPTKTDRMPSDGKAFDVLEMRVGKITQWFPKHVTVSVYDEETGLMKEFEFHKKSVAILESPFYTLLNDSNPTLQILRRKLELMDSMDKDVASGKLNGFLQFPYQTRSETRVKQAERRLREIEHEMKTSQYGIVGLDANEKFVPAGSGLDNNIVDDVRNLTKDFYNNIGITEKILDGTASPSEINAYYYKTIDPVLQTIVDGINRAFLSETARTKGQVVMYYRDPFRTLPVESLSSTADVFSRNAILTPNEIRRLIGKPPHPDAQADQLYNRNIADGNQNGGIMTPGQMDPNGDPMMEEDPSLYDDPEYMEDELDV